MPEVQQVHVDAALTNLSVAYKNNDFVAELLAPRVPVRKQSDRYFIYDTERESMRPTLDMRAPGTLADEVNYSLSTQSYYCEDHALASAIPDEERENADPVIQPDMDRTEYLTERILLNQEIILHGLLSTEPTVGETELGLGQEWFETGADPLGDIQTARMDVFSKIQRLPNVLVLPPDVYKVLRDHPLVLDRIKYSDVGVVTPELPGQPPQVSPLWAGHAYLVYVSPRPGLKQLTFANTFVWNGMPGSDNGVIVERWREHGRKADMIRVQKYYDCRIVAGGAAHRITGVLGQ